MNDDQFMGFRIRFDDGGCTNSGRQSIRGTPNSMVEDVRTVLGNQFVGLRTRWWRMHEWQSIHGAPDSMVEDA